MDKDDNEPPVNELISPNNWFWARKSLKREASIAGIGMFETSRKTAKRKNIKRTLFLRSGLLNSCKILSILFI